MPSKKHKLEEIIGKLREVEIVLAQGGSTADVLIQLNSRENVAVAAQANGGFALDYLPEPERLFDDPFAPGDLPEIPLLTEVVTA